MKYLLVIFVSFFIFSVFSNQEKNREIYKKALESCSSLKGNNFSDDSVLDILYGENLNLNCLTKTLSEYSYIGPDLISDKDIKSKLDNNTVKVIEITAARKKCYRGESEYYCINNIIIEGKRFIYIINDTNIKSQPIKENLVHILIDETTHDKNYTYNMTSNTLSELGDGAIIFKEDFVVKRGVKSYWFKGDKSLGPFWYDVKVDFEGNYLELINYEDPDGRKCFTYDEFEGSSIRLREAMKKQNLKEFCVWRK